MESIIGRGISKYARWWMFVVYYGISSIWLWIPLILLSKH